MHARKNDYEVNQYMQERKHDKTDVGIQANNYVSNHPKRANKQTVSEKLTIESYTAYMQANMQAGGKLTIKQVGKLENKHATNRAQMDNKAMATNP